MIYIETPRLLLRDWRKEDLPVFVEMNRDPGVMKYFPKLLKPEESYVLYDRIQKEFDRYGYGLYAVEVKESGKFIGYIGLHYAVFEAGFTPCWEIGWRLSLDAWGRGYATEGAQACLQNAFGQLKLLQIYSFTSKLNLRSERVMQKIGMRKLGEFNHPLLPDGHPLRLHLLYMQEAVD